MAIKLNSVKKILIFEPWNLGDLVISVYFAKILNEMFKIRFDFVCNPRWLDWLKEESFIDNVYAFHAPWTDKNNKYSISKYSFTKIISLKSEIRQDDYNFIWDVRGDLRHKLFLNLLSDQKVLSINYKNNLNVYDRINELFIKLDINIIEHETYLYNGSYNVCLFLDSYWNNKKVPYEVGVKIIDELLNRKFSVSLIKAPEGNYDIYENKFDNRITYYKGSIINIVNILSTMSLCISTDSAWLHMAYYKRIPTIGLFGSLNGKQWAPPGTKIIYSDEPLKAKVRYKLKNENIFPLMKLDINKIINTI